MLLENPLPILAAGVVLATLFGLLFMARRNLPSLVGLGAVLLFTSLLLITEKLVVTPGEEVEQSLENLMVAVRSNEVSSVLKLIDPAANQIRGEAEKLMPMVNVEDTGATAIQVEVDTQTSPPTATSRCKGRLRGVHTRSGVTVFFFDQVEFNWIRRGDAWLLEDFAVFQDGRALDAVKSLRGNRAAAAPATR